MDNAINYLPATHKASVFFPDSDVDYAIRCGAPVFRHAIWMARDFLQSCHTAREVHSICTRADGAIWGIRVTRNGWRKVFVFRGATV